jgi:hypothetical protein
MWNLVTYLFGSLLLCVYPIRTKPCFLLKQFGGSCYVNTSTQYSSGFIYLLFSLRMKWTDASVQAPLFGL